MSVSDGLKGPLPLRKVDTRLMLEKQGESRAIFEPDPRCPP